MHIHSKNGVTLLEIVVVAIIVGIMATFAIPNLQGMVNSGRANDAQNNLLAIYAAQKNRFATTNPPSYCTGTTTTALTNTCLGLNIISNNTVYACTNVGGFTCTAVVNGGTFTLTLTNAQVNLVMPYNAAARNPRCTAGTCPTS